MSRQVCTVRTEKQKGSDTESMRLREGEVIIYLGLWGLKKKTLITYNNLSILLNRTRWKLFKQLNYSPETARWNLECSHQQPNSSWANQHFIQHDLVLKLTSYCDTQQPLSHQQRVREVSNSSFELLSLPLGYPPCEHKCPPAWCAWYSKQTYDRSWEASQSDKSGD